FGMTGLETALPLVLALVRDGVIPLARAIALLTVGPARCYGLEAGTLAEGASADVAGIDVDRAWSYGRGTSHPQSMNSPLQGPLVGRAVLTLLGGRPVHDVGGLLA